MRMLVPKLRKSDNSTSCKAAFHRLIGTYHKAENLRVFDPENLLRTINFHAKKKIWLILIAGEKIADSFIFLFMYFDKKTTGKFYGKMYMVQNIHKYI